MGRRKETIGGKTGAVNLLADSENALFARFLFESDAFH